MNPFIIRSASTDLSATSNPPTCTSDLSNAHINQNPAFNCSSLAHALPTAEGTRTVTVSTGTESKPDADSAHAVSNADVSDVSIPLIDRIVTWMPINIYARNKCEYMPLHLATQENDIQKVKDLISASADLNVKETSNGFTPLHLAALFGHPEIVGLLLSGGANVDEKDNFENTPLHLASATANAVAVELLLYNGADVNIKNHFSYTALHLAAMYGYVVIVEFLLSMNANIFIRDDESRTPYRIALENDYLAVAELLIAAGANNKP